MMNKLHLLIIRFSILLLALCSINNAFAKLDELTVEEKHWIKQNPVIKFTGDPNWLPYEAFDANGVYYGIVADHLQEIQMQTGLSFQTIAVSSWTEALELAIAGQVDVISGDAADVILNNNFNPINAYSENPIVIIMKGTQSYVDDLIDIQDKRIAIIKDYGYTADILKTYPKISFIEVENIQQGLEGVSTGKIDAMLATMALASYHIAEMGMHHVEIVGKTSIDMKLTLFVSKKKPLLYSILNKSMQLIPNEAKHTIVQKRVKQKYVEKIDYQLISQLSLLFFAILCFIFFWNVRLNKEIKKRVRAEKALMKSELRFRTIFSEAPLGIAVIDSLTGHIYDANDAYAQIAGRSIAELRALDWMDITHPDDIQEDLDNMAQMNAGETIGFTMQKRYIQPDGDVRWIKITIARMQVNDNSIRCHLCMTEDITHDIAQQELLKKMAHYDVLTQLPNRALLVDRFSQAQARSKRQQSLLAVCFLDLDNFKPVNDVYGHELGDELLIEVASRIKENIRDEDTVSRQGGDEFALLLGNIESFIQCEQMLKRIIAALSQPYRIEEQLISISASIGVTLYPTDDSDLDTLMRHADQAMYQAKLAGRNRYSLFSTEQAEKSVRKMSQLQEIEQALINNEFCLYYQPKVNMSTGKVFGAEALIRWNHPEKGVVPPLDFLPAVNGSNLEILIGNWVVNEALKQLDQWKQQGVELELSVNISSYHLQYVNFLADLEEAMALYPQVDSKYLQLEILESSALGDVGSISRILKSCCNNLGVRVALDDFGTGYSSLTHLRNLPAQTIKIDQSFIRDMLDDPDDFAIIDGVIGLADSFNRVVIAEGVEATEHGLMLMMMGCYDAQGYGISRPMPVDGFGLWLSCYQPNKEWKNFKKYSYTTKEIKRQMLKLTLQHLQNKFEDSIRSLEVNSDHWPVMQRTKCHCGTFIKQAKNDKLFEDRWVNALTEAHNSVHDITEDLFDKYQQGEFECAADGLRDFRVAMGNVFHVIEQCK